jgi:UDP-3-O-[3-hydroxymyristoyl] glucosamine N-acyltransferase
MRRYEPYELLETYVPKESDAYPFPVVVSEPASRKIYNVCHTFDDAVSCLTFIRAKTLDDIPIMSFDSYLENVKARFVIVPAKHYTSLPHWFADGRVLFVTTRPRLLFCYMAQPYIAAREQDDIWDWNDPIHPAASIGEHTVILPGSGIGPYTSIGMGCIIGPRAVINNAKIGNGVRIGANVSIGGDGFGFEYDRPLGNVLKFPHIDSVVIEDNVEIMAGTCVARGALSKTIIKKDVKIDQLCHIAHGCVIEEGAFIIANTMLGGSTTVGPYAWVAPSTSTHQKREIGKFGMTGIGAVVINDIPEGEIHIGVPAKKLKDREDVK